MEAPNSNSNSNSNPNPNPESIEDIFESSLNLEDTHYREGYNEGYQHGLQPGRDEARQVGLKTGFQLGEELGFYQGFIDIWNSAIRVDPDWFSTRVQKGVKTMEGLVSKYKVLEPEDEGGTEIMESLRLKFRGVCGSLNLKGVEYSGYPKSSEEF